MATTLRSLPGALALLLYPLLLLGLAVGTVWWVVLGLVTEGLQWWQPLSGALAVWVVLGLRGLTRTPEEPETITVSRDDAPALWGMVEGLADRLDAPAPGRILLVPDVNASAQEGASGGDSAGHDLILGLALVAGMTVGQLRAVVAHELGHLADAPASMSRPHQRLWELTGRGSCSTGPVCWLALLVMGLHALADGPRRQRTEHLADTWSLRAATRDEALDGLRSMHRTGARYEHAVETYLALLPMAGLRAPLTEGLRQILSTPDVPGERRVLGDVLEHEPHRLWHTHPPVRVRLERMANHPAPSDAPTAPDQRPAIDLVPQGVLTRTEGLLVGEERFPLSDWATVVDLGATTALVDDATDLARRLTEDTGHPVRSYDDILDALVAQGRTDPYLICSPAQVLSPTLVEEHRREEARGEDDVEPTEDQKVTGILTQLGAACLAESPGIHPVVLWPGFALDRDDGSRVDLDAPLAGRHGWADLVAALRSAVEADGGDLGLAPGERCPSPDSQLAGATQVTGPWDRPHDVLVTTRGLLALPAPEWTAESADHEEERLQEFAERSVSLLRARPDAWELPWDRIEAVHVRGLVTPRLTIRTTEGEQLRLSGVRMRTAATPDLELVLRHMLGDRLLTGRRSV